MKGEQMRRAFCFLLIGIITHAALATTEPNDPCDYNIKDVNALQKLVEQLQEQIAKQEHTINVAKQHIIKLREENVELQRENKRQERIISDSENGIPVRRDVD